mmetsp:Transcript_75033/g.176104  ORF Transcript_75033/g.176104 Transcript_75033/m.176104 type:complete len:330 (-) Transcript_75033:4705-5694(-)
MDDLALDRAEVLGVADDSVVKACTHGQQHIAVLHGHVGLVGAVHAEHAEETRVGARHCAQAHQRVGAGEAEQVDQLAQLGRGFAQDDPAAGVDVRAPGLQQQLHGLADLAAVALLHRVVGPHLDAVRVAEHSLGKRDILGDVHDDRAGTAGAGDVEGLLQRQRQIAHVLDEEVVLDDWPRDAHRVALLEGIQADRRRGHLARDDDHRDRVHIGRRDAGDGIRDARARGHQGDADLAGRSRKAVGGMDGGLLVAHQHMLDALLLVERVVDVEHRAAGVAPEVAHPFGLQAANEDLGAVELRGGGCGGEGSRLRQGGALEFRGRHVHFEPL